MQSKMNRKGLWLLLTLAVLIVAVSVLVTVAILADPAPEPEITEFGYQTLSALDLTSDDETDLRFYFKINKLTYNEVGFVVSKSNSTPTIGGANCYKAGTDTVYSTINAGGEPMVAGSGYYWVAVRLTDIPHTYFDGTLYIRAFVADGKGTRYSNAATLTVCIADGHTHVIENEDLVGTTDATMDHVGTRIGHCDGCNLDNVTEYGESYALNEYKKWNAGSADNWVESCRISSILGGTKHFYPDASNDGQGNDLLVEFSILWNESLLNFSSTVSGGARLETKFAWSYDSKNGAQNAKSIAYLGLTNDAQSTGAKIAGAFEYPCPQIATPEEGNLYPNMNKDEQTFDDYPNIGGSDPDHPEWGWHRIGIRYHEEVTNLALVESSGVAAEYKLTVTLYVDGEIVSVLSGTELEAVQTVKDADDIVHDYKLYTVKKVGDELQYSDINGDYYLLSFYIWKYKAELYDTYFIDGDFFATCGHDFVLPVTRIDNPAERTETVDGKDFVAPFYYTTVGSHDHVWGEPMNDASASADCGHAATKSIHCTICGATQTVSTVDLAVDPSRHVYSAYKTYQAPSRILGDGVERRTCVCCGVKQDRTGADSSKATAIYSKTFVDDATENYKDNALLSDIQKGTHFYPTPANPEGKDLLIEFSLLWNHTLLNLKTDGQDPYITTRISNKNGGDENNLAYWSPAANIDDAWCKYAGGWEAGGLQLVEPAGASYTPAGMCGKNGGFNAYPNIGGAVAANAGNLNNGHEWGWHHVQIRYHQEVYNPTELAAGTQTAKYKFVVTTYFDGVAVSMLKGTSDDEKHFADKNALFLAENDGNGGIRYLDNPKLNTNDSDKRNIFAFRFNATMTKTGTSAYWKEADIHYTCGNEFAMKVKKVASPAYVDLEIDTGVHVNAAVYFEFNND